MSSLSKENQILINLLKKIYFFSDLDESTYHKLIPQYQHITLYPGENLFEQGDLSERCINAMSK